MDKRLDYLLKETETAVRIMHRDKTTAHIFDFGSSPTTGEKYIVLIAILPEEAEARLKEIMGPTFPSKPLETV